MRKLGNEPLKINDSPANRRLPKLESLLRSEVGSAMERELELPGGALLTITSVKVLPDLSQTRIGVSILPTEKQDQVFKILISATSNLQRIVNRRLKLYRVPRISFYFDDSLEKADKIDRLLDNLSTK
ncbi:MAG TPA: 30S ribosome-binding factor RbfA [Candidatus Veblenbacteria bacterium]|uniref:Ribosome-binding factor A n=1 Tax=Candidatus Veblenbacteria bacterium RIFOXYB1_FULL_43_13 TaxID=1802426 RepID=A0A1G2Q3P1_9BACT|nr:MAG: Ribosome-binding factor A [Parcubacteria group bacterium GW2011_GWA1_43_27]KKT17200.1 MAG: Ribosome-binding factor A [Parcubacteria group bacterium GW2011_GWB1_43_66]OHA55215.1 MAG: ribosome-binding factor A [Candidatus Veblenbacteria bacterium RIFOXYB1_FULL_43_13]HBH16923.1 30S ribosome-binding factor RbfA [Candidatus Veblenbacteria bacterium]HCM45656.1 30S ribosome-binding factor RbfA [Candidatus Veblenbacteria bacterium]